MLLIWILEPLHSSHQAALQNRSPLPSRSRRQYGWSSTVCNYQSPDVLFAPTSSPLQTHGGRIDRSPLLEPIWLIVPAPFLTTRALAMSWPFMYVQPFVTSTPSALPLSKSPDSTGINAWVVAPLRPYSIPPHLTARTSRRPSLIKLSTWLIAAAQLASVRSTRRQTNFSVLSYTNRRGQLSHLPGSPARRQWLYSLHKSALKAGRHPCFWIPHAPHTAIDLLNTSNTSESLAKHTVVRVREGCRRVV